MNTENLDSTTYILETLLEKSVVKKETYTVTLEMFNSFKKVMNYFITNYKKQLKGANQKISLSYTDTDTFEARMQVAGDLMIFNMHSNVFTFDHEHWVWKSEYVKSDERNAYCGVINVYNFIADSFKYKRLSDFGYIIARIFINREGHYFLEGNPNFGSYCDDFGKQKLDIQAIRDIIQLIIQYALEVDLVVPQLENIQLSTVEQMMDTTNQTKIETGKPLGFRSNANK